jgi:hypothetical protein
MQIEHFLQKDIDKTPLPEGFGEGPEYIGRSGRKPGGRHRKHGGKPFHKNNSKRSKKNDSSSK